MCLILDSTVQGPRVTPWWRYKINAETITCYKVVTKFRRKRTLRKNAMGKRSRYNYKGLYQSSYIYKRNNEEPRFKELYDRLLERDSPIYINDGFHCFEKFEHAVKELDSWLIVYNYNTEPDRQLVIVRCEIPAGSMYFYGKTEDGYPCYCSNKLNFIDEITFKKI